MRWVGAKADRRGYVMVDGREYVASPARHSGELLVGVRPSTVEVLADRGRRVAVLPRAFGEGLAVRNPMSLLPALAAGPRAFGESTIRRGMPEAHNEGIDRMDGAGRRQTLRAIGRAGAACGFEAACLAAERVVEGGHVPDDATFDVLSRRIAAGSGERGGDAPVGLRRVPEGGGRRWPLTGTSPAGWSRRAGRARSRRRCWRKGRRSGRRSGWGTWPAASSVARTSC